LFKKKGEREEVKMEGRSKKKKKTTRKGGTTATKKTQNTSD